MLLKRTDWFWKSGLIAISFILMLSISGCTDTLSGEEKNSDFQFGLDDNSYREYVYKTVQKDSRPYLQQILMSIDASKFFVI